MLRDTSDRLDALLRELDAQANHSVRDRIHEVVALLMEVHRAGLERVVALASDSALGGDALIGRLADDPVVGPLLLIHDAHPYALDVRVARALERLRPQVAAHGCRASVAGIDGGVVRVRLEGGARLSDRSQLEQTIETGLLDAAPELVNVVVDLPRVEPVFPASSPLIQILKRPLVAGSEP